MAVEREQWKFDTLCDLYDTLTITQACGAWERVSQSRTGCRGLKEKTNLVPSSFLLLLVGHLSLVAWHLFLLASEDFVSFVS